MNAQTYRIPETNLGGLQVRIEALNKRAHRLDLEPIAIAVTGHEDVPLVQAGRQLREDPGADADTVIAYRRYHFVDISGQDPVLNGWRFVATLQHLAAHNGEEPQSIINVVPGAEIPEAYRTADPLDCDHCRRRIARRDTYLVESIETGEHKQVGSTCLRDFLGHSDPHALANYAEALIEAAALAAAAEDEGWMGGGGSAPDHLEVRTFLHYTARAIREWGWRSRSKARDEGGDATADAALDLMFPTRGGRQSEELDPPNDGDKARADEALEWARCLRESDDLDDYRHNLRVIANSGVMEWRNAGLVASMIASFEYEREPRAERAPIAGSEYVGEIGQRIEFHGKVIGLLPLAGTYGPLTLVKFLTGDGNLLVWFATGDPLAKGADGASFELGFGETYEVKARVKGHGEREGIKQTVVTRAKVRRSG